MPLHGLFNIILQTSHARVQISRQRSLTPSMFFASKLCLSKPIPWNKGLNFHDYIGALANCLNNNFIKICGICRRLTYLQKNNGTTTNSITQIWESPEVAQYDNITQTWRVKFSCQSQLLCNALSSLDGSIDAESLTLSKTLRFRTFFMSSTLSLRPLHFFLAIAFKLCLGLPFWALISFTMWIFSRHSPPWCFCSLRSSELPIGTW